MTDLVLDPAWDRIVQLGERTICYSSCRVPLSAGNQEKIAASLHAKMEGFNILQYFAKQPKIFSEYDLLVVAVERDAPIGLLGGRWFDLNGSRNLYVWTIFIGDAHRRTALFSEMVALFVGAGCRPLPPFVALKTFSPQVYELAARLSVYPEMKFYPKIPSEEQDQEMIDVARRSMAEMFPALRFDAETGVVFGGQAAVGLDVFPAMPRVMNRTIMEFFERHISASDQVLVLMKTPPWASLTGAATLAGILAPRVARALESWTTRE